jgi:hypothetical protein
MNGEEPIYLCRIEEEIHQRQDVMLEPPNPPQADARGLATPEPEAAEESPTNAANEGA